MSLPPYVYVDRRLPDADRVRETLEDRTLTPFGEDERLERLHRVFYPAFRVSFRYETGKGQWFGTEEREDTVFLDGLWADNDAHVSRYAGETDELLNVATGDYDFGDGEGLGPSVLLQFQVDNDTAGTLLPERVADWARQRDAGRGDQADVFLRKLRENYGLPGEFDPAGFDEVTEVTRVYLPFWLAEYRSDDADHSIMLAFRDPEADEAEFKRHGWLSEFVADDPTRLAEYGYDLSLDRVQKQLSRDDRAGAGGGDDAGDGPDGRSPDRSFGGGDGAGGDGEDEIVQPEGVDMDASSLVERQVERGFGDVGGMRTLKETLRHKVIRPLEDPETFEEYGVGVVNGVLLHGPPGCGKTYIAEALAGEVGHDFVEISPADLTSKYMGEPAQKVKELFEIARANQPCLLFIDEIDAIAGTRDGDANMNSSEQQMVNQLLTELEDASEDDVVVMGATNLVDDVDPAIRRSGRFDERVEVPPPDADARREIVEVHLAGRPTADEIDLEGVVEATAGYAASDLELIAENAARKALRAGEAIGESHLLAAAEDASSSIPDWSGPTDADDHVEQPADADLNARSLVDPDPALDFADVGGMADLKDRLRETVIEPLNDPDRFADYGLDVLDGLLLYGPPGCGKTYLATALAGELGHNFLSVTPADLTSKWMGKPAQNVADLFSIAAANAPCVLFVDEIDAIAGSRTGGMNTSEQQMVNQLLAELEDVGDDVVVVGATNLLEDIDGAIRRSGRFDERIEVPPPDAEARREILGVHLRDRPLADGLDWTTVVDRTEGYAASDLELIAENAARAAMRADEPIDTAHLEGAVDRTGSSIEDWLARR
ncbi:AAA family ATPase [Halorientalis halophila]|uniref:AAA family ATPase n=1 Tax=Halorientalis halophila TaxID=3108499 RepID=UPI00300971FF